MSRTFSGQEFARALSSGDLRGSVEITGMVKKSDGDSAVILFTPGASCGNWIPIPVDMIDRVERLGNAPCVDHAHEYVQITLKHVSGPEATILASLLRSYVERKALPSPEPAVMLARPAHGVVHPPSLAAPRCGKLMRAVRVADVTAPQDGRTARVQPAHPGATFACRTGAHVCSGEVCLFCCQGTWYETGYNCGATFSVTCGEATYYVEACGWFS